MKTFNSALECAKWILAQNFSELRTERLMVEAVQHFRVNGTFTIQLSPDDIVHTNMNQK